MMQNSGESSWQESGDGSRAPYETSARTTIVMPRPVFMPDNFSGQDREWAD